MDRPGAGGSAALRRGPCTDSARRHGSRLLVGLAFWLGTSACSPLYVIRAGLAEARILSARRPLAEVILDGQTDARLQGKLTLTREARIYAVEELGLDAGDAFTSYSALERDTLAMVVSAAYRTRLAARTWWFPIVGHVPYRAYFDFEAGARERAKLEAEGFDALLRPTSAFSTLGWFADPLLSTTARADEVSLVETVLHELSHNHLFVPGQVTFNESFAQFVGNVGAMRFFCTRPGGGADTVWCRRAQARWRDEIRFSQFIDGLVAELETLYGRTDLSEAEKLSGREAVFQRHRERFASEVQPTFEAGRYQSFLDQPLNNATLLGRMRYYHRLGDFDQLWRGMDQDLPGVLRALRAQAATVADPWELLPTGR
ncbi:MAG: aminopeptidase [Gemmatimonadota bacterium]